MGFAKGSELAQNIWDDMKKVLDDKQKLKLKKSLIKNLEDCDCDNLDEVTWR